MYFHVPVGNVEFVKIRDISVLHRQFFPPPELLIQADALEWGKVKKCAIWIRGGVIVTFVLVFVLNFPLNLFCICLCICFCICLCISLCICLCICLCIFLHLPLYLSLHLSLYLSLYLPFDTPLLSQSQQ